MAAITGVTGSVVITASAQGEPTTLLLNRWTANIRRDVHETSAWDNAFNHKTKVGGMYDLVGSAEGFLDSASNVVAAAASGWDKEDAAASAFVLTASTGRTLSFSGLCSNYRITSEKNGVVGFAIDFESSGAVTPA